MFRQFVVFSLALHDIGKFARAFQSLARPIGADLVPPEPRMVYEASYRHDALGAQLWSRHLWAEFKQAPAKGWSQDVQPLSRLRNGLALWLAPFFGHHGKPVEASRRPLENWFRPDDLAAASDFVEAVSGLLQPVWPCSLLADPDWVDRCLAPVTWELAGLAVASDWRGSDSDLFGYISDPMPLEQYWKRHALPQAEKAVQQSGLVGRPDVASFPGFRDTFGFAPRALQKWAETVELGEGPQLFLLEDLTGAGKTEAALTLAHRLMAAGLARGLYLGLPTMATSNAMYTRVGAIYRRFFAEDGQPPSIVLAHGSRHLHEAFVRSLWPPQQEEAAYTPAEEGGSAACNAWLGDSRKKALLADVGVGTIDQALLGILPRRHQSLRLLGLADKVLLVDEVHAYDTYTGTLLERLLEAHARQGGSAILLSATVPQSIRRRLLEAWRRGRGLTGPTDIACTDFPLATHEAGRGPKECPLGSTETGERSLPVEFLSEEERAVDRVVSAAAAGQCVCWIRNTVDDAIRAYDALQQRLVEFEQVLLFHARFVMGDRQHIEDEALSRFGPESRPESRRGQVLIATQVVEQSLDLDFDALISDLAPIELLVQRAGRLHRHARRADGSRQPDPAMDDERPAATLHVLAPPWDADPDPNWVKRTLPGTSHVYSDAGQLWLTQRVLRENGGIHLPEQARALLEAVYAEDAEVPEGLEAARGHSYAEERAHASTAGFSALDLSRGYTRDSAAGGWDDDQEAGTRLSEEPSVQVVLLRRGSEEGPRPWIEDARHPWPMSTVYLRQSLANEVPPIPPEWEKALEGLGQRHRQLRFARFWAIDEGAPSGLRYDSERGVVHARDL